MDRFIEHCEPLQRALQGPARWSESSWDDEDGRGALGERWERVSVRRHGVVGVLPQHTVVEAALAASTSDIHFVPDLVTRDMACYCLGALAYVDGNPAVMGRTGCIEAMARVAADGPPESSAGGPGPALGCLAWLAWKCDTNAEAICALQLVNHLAMAECCRAPMRAAGAIAIVAERAERAAGEDDDGDVEEEDRDVVQMACQC
eukprot:gene28557-22605_t